MAANGLPRQSNLVCLMPVGTLSQIQLNPGSDAPLYKQLAESIRALVNSGTLGVGERLPPTRELAARLGLNRTTVSAAYAMLEKSGLLEGHVGRGSFVSQAGSTLSSAQVDWDAMLPPARPVIPPADGISISFANSRPSETAFPLAQFRRLSKQVVDGPEASGILQLGPPHGYAPLRRFLLNDAAGAGIARANDDVAVTNGCQQALDLLARLFITDKQAIAVEDPVYHGVLRVFSRAGARLIPVPVDHAGIDPNALYTIVKESRPRLLVVTPSFQNPTGATLPLERRQRIVEIAQRFGLVLIENDIYSDLRYRGKALPSLKQLDASGQTVLLRSYSKIAFPGLRVGWVIAPRAVITHLADIKQTSDLHSDQLSQAILLRFAESGELSKHLERTRSAGLQKLNAVTDACERYLPPGSNFTKPDGGMNLWIELPQPLTAARLLEAAREQGVDFLPGNCFSSGRAHEYGLRLSFGALPPEQIRRGVQILGEAAAGLRAGSRPINLEPAAALV